MELDDTLHLVNEIHNLTGGGIARTYLPSSDNRVYFGYVTLENCRYPDKGIAVNRGQTEGLFILEGEFKATYKDQELMLHEGDVIYFEENNPYFLFGTGKIIVAITPGSGGKTEVIENE